MLQAFAGMKFAYRPAVVTPSNLLGESNMRNLAVVALLAMSIGGCSRPAASTVVDRDDTAVNTRDSDGAAKTPIDQNENQSDIDITANIRKQVVDTEMSVNAQNVKIITQDGKVTLRGPVKSPEEKQKIEAIASSVAGSDKVDSQLEVESQP